MRGMLERLIGEDVELATHLQPQLLRVTADPNQLEQVVMNLAVNARDAMPTGGRLTFKTANVTVGDNGMAGSPEVASGSYAELAVSDSGMGMDPEVRGRIFEPFFTTKEIGKGTGLGLSVAYGIVRQSGGYIVVESEPGHGSTFRILLPATVEAAAASVEEARAPFLPAGSETILIVEDEEAVRVMMATLLMHAGYVVHAEEAPKAAIEWAHAAPRLDLVVTDVVMPQMNGRIMAGALLETFPRAKVLFVSGYTEDEVVRNQALEERVHFLPKPFLPKDLIVKVREILDS
jgi:CheY-like chemotaxis protein